MGVRKQKIFIRYKINTSHRRYTLIQFSLGTEDPVQLSSGKPEAKVQGVSDQLTGDEEEKTFMNSVADYGSSSVSRKGSFFS